MTAPAAFQLGDRVTIRGTAHKFRSDTRTIYVAADGPPFDWTGTGRGREYPEGGIRLGRPTRRESAPSPPVATAPP